MRTGQAVATSQNVCQAWPCFLFHQIFTAVCVVFLFPRFSFLNGICKDSSTPNRSSDSNLVECGFYTMDVRVDGERYRRHRDETFLFTNISIPRGSSYACGDNVRNTYYSVPVNYSDLNTDKKDEITNISVFHFTSLQVRVASMK